MDESLIDKPPGEASPRLISLVGVDCSQLVLADIDLSQCCHLPGPILVVNSGSCGEAEFESCQVAGSLPV